jgi:hypothetical protein
MSEDVALAGIGLRLRPDRSEALPIDSEPAHVQLDTGRRHEVPAQDRHIK